MLRRLMEANIRLETGTVDEIVGLLEELRSAWQELANGPRETLAAPVPVQPPQQPMMMKAGVV